MLAATEAQLADKTARSRSQRESAAAAAAAAARQAATAAAATVAQRDAIREERDRARGAKVRIASERSNKAAELRADVRKGLARAARAAARDRAEREDLVRQIRAVEKVPSTRTKQFDRTETGGHRLLDEMSLVVRFLCSTRCNLFTLCAAPTLRIDPMSDRNVCTGAQGTAGPSRTSKWGSR